MGLINEKLNNYNKYNALDYSNNTGVRPGKTV